MGKRDRRTDAYIAKSADFARPILTHLRALVHEACPDADEAIKWGMPLFVRGGALLCFMAAFKQHAAFGFRGGERLVGARAVTEKAMGQFGRITSVAGLPSRKTIVSYVKKAAALNEPGAEDLRVFPPSHRREYVEWIAGAKREETRQRRIATAVEWMAEGKSQAWRYEK
jgi:hypothetical protein